MRPSEAAARVRCGESTHTHGSGPEGCWPAFEVQVPNGGFRPRSRVVSTRVGDSVVLLDRASERYFTLNEVAGEIWEQLVAGAAPAQIANRLCSEYDAPREQVAADVVAQIEGLLRSGLIEHASVGGSGTPSAAGGRDAPLRATAEAPQSITAAGPSRDIRLLSYLRCALVITALKLRLAVQGYDRTLTWVRRQVEGVAVTACASIEAVRAAEYRVAMVGALYPGRALCLEQSLTLYYLMRRRGVAVEYCQGVQPHPFQAHAWVEYQGEVITDIPEHVKPFVKLLEQLP